jgi:hypothetical protein
MGREDEKEDMNSYWTTLRKRQYLGTGKKKL